jgi:hypothetical protein
MKNLTEVTGYRNAKVLRKFLTIFSISQEEAENIFTELMKFLWLCAVRRAEYKESVPEVPSALAVYSSMAIMDELWHTFILHTEDYSSFCSLYLGSYVHHSPANVDFVQLTETESAAQLSYTWDKLGEGTVITWYESLGERYSPAVMQSLLKPHVFGKPCESL